MRTGGSRAAGLLIAAGEIEVRSSGWIDRARQDQGIIGAAMCALPGAKDCRVLAILLDSLDGERSAGDIEGGADSGGKAEEVGMFEGQVDRAEASHGDAHDGAVGAVWGGGELLLNVRDQIVGDVVFVAVLRAGRLRWV